MGSAEADSIGPPASKSSPDWINRPPVTAIIATVNANAMAAIPSLEMALSPTAGRLPRMRYLT